MYYKKSGASPTRYAGQLVHHEWPGVFVGHPQALKGLWMRPGEADDEANGRDGEAKVAALSDEERAKLRQKEKGYILFIFGSSYLCNHVIHFGSRIHLC